MICLTLGYTLYSTVVKLSSAERELKHTSLTLMLDILTSLILTPVVKNIIMLEFKYVTNSIFFALGFMLTFSMITYTFSSTILFIKGKFSTLFADMQSQTNSEPPLCVGNRREVPLLELLVQFLSYTTLPSYYQSRDVFIFLSVKISFLVGLIQNTYESTI